MGRLTTHVLDTAQGTPATGVTIELWRLDGEEKVLVKRVATNADGRTDDELLAGAAFSATTYELVFHIGPYFAVQPVVTADPPFLDVVPVRFTITDAEAHYHVPLLVSPWAYSTYRGS